MNKKNFTFWGLYNFERVVINLVAFNKYFVLKFKLIFVGKTELISKQMHGGQTNHYYAYICRYKPEELKSR